MKNSILNQEQKDFLCSKVWQHSKDFCEAVVTKNDTKVINFLRDEHKDWALSDAELSFLFRYGNMEMQAAYINSFVVPMFIIEEMIDNKQEWGFITLAILKNIKAENKIPVHIIEKYLLNHDSINLFTNLTTNCLVDNNWGQVPQIIKNKDLLEQVVFYAYHPEFTPVDFWKKSEHRLMVVERPDLFDEMPKESFLTLLPYTRVGKTLKDSKHWKEFNADMAITMFTKGAYSITDIAQHSNVLFSNEDLEKLFDCDIPLFQAIVEVMEINWIKLFSKPISAKVLKFILVLRLEYRDVSTYDVYIMGSQHINLILQNIIEKELWSEGIIRRTIHRRLNDIVLAWLTKMEWSQCQSLKLYEENIIRFCDYDCIKCMLDKFGLQDSDNEKYFSYINLREDREKIICFYHEKYGFKSKIGKKIWKEYCKKQTNKLSCWQRIKKCFG